MYKFSNVKIVRGLNEKVLHTSTSSKVEAIVDATDLDDITVMAYYENSFLVSFLFIAA